MLPPCTHLSPSSIAGHMDESIMKESPATLAAKDCFLPPLAQSATVQQYNEVPTNLPGSLGTKNRLQVQGPGDAMQEVIFQCA